MNEKLLENEIQGVNKPEISENQIASFENEAKSAEELAEPKIEKEQNNDEVKIAEILETIQNEPDTKPVKEPKEAEEVNVQEMNANDLEKINPEYYQKNYSKLVEKNTNEVDIEKIKKSIETGVNVLNNLGRDSAEFQPKIEKQIEEIISLVEKNSLFKAKKLAWETVRKFNNEIAGFEIKKAEDSISSLNGQFPEFKQSAQALYEQAEANYVNDKFVEAISFARKSSNVAECALEKINEEKEIQDIKERQTKANSDFAASLRLKGRIDNNILKQLEKIK